MIDRSTLLTTWSVRAMIKWEVTYTRTAPSLHSPTRVYCTDCASTTEMPSIPQKVRPRKLSNSAGCINHKLRDERRDDFLSYVARQLMFAHRERMMTKSEVFHADMNRPKSDSYTDVPS